MSQEILTFQVDGIFTIQMNRPEKHNAITQHMYRSMAQALRTADADDAVRVVVIRGMHNLFTSGNDIKDFQARAATGQGDGKTFATAEFFEGVLGLCKPLIAAVNGHAIGIGTTMLLHCDLVYAGKSAIFRLPFVNLGLCPEFGSSQLLSQLVGHRRAAETFMFGDAITADQALEMGIVNRVFDDRNLMDEVMAIAGTLAQKSPAALMATKKLMKGHNAEALNQVIQTESEMFFKLMLGPEAAEAFAAFTEKREPDFSKF